MNRRFLIPCAALLLLVVLAGCSVVFEAGVSGNVYTYDGTSRTAVSGVNVFVYTDKGLRDSDYSKFESGAITRPTSGAGYVSTTTTNSNGDFTVNKVVWETKKSEFGKTADVNTLYLIFYHKDYYVEKANATVISGSTNSSNVDQQLRCSKDYATVTVTVRDVTTGQVMTSACTLDYQLEGKQKDSVVMTGTSTFRVSFDKGTTTNLVLSLSNPGSCWVMTDKTGAATDNETVADIANGTLSVTLYMKNLELVLPAFSGSIDKEITDDGAPATNSNDNVPVWLEYETDGSWVRFDETYNAGHKTGNAVASTTSNNVFYSHGNFSGVGNSGTYTITINKSNYPNIKWYDKEGKTPSVKLKLCFGSPVDKSYEFEYSSVKGGNFGFIGDDLV